MALDFGMIESVAVAGNDVCITGHRYVALAFDHDDPYCITRLINVDSADLSQDKIELISQASDIYDSEITEVDGTFVVRIVVNDSIEVFFRCERVMEESRYYTPEEIRDIFSWLPSGCTDDQLNSYVRALRTHGFSVTFPDGTAVVDTL